MSNNEQVITISEVTQDECVPLESKCESSNAPTGPTDRIRHQPLPSRPLCEKFLSPFSALTVGQELETAYECYICQNGKVLRELIRLIVREEISNAVVDDILADIDRQKTTQ